MADQLGGARAIVGMQARQPFGFTERGVARLEPAQGPHLCVPARGAGLPVVLPGAQPDAAGGERRALGGAAQRELGVALVGDVEDDAEDEALAVLDFGLRVGDQVTLGPIGAQDPHRDDDGGLAAGDPGPVAAQQIVTIRRCHMTLHPRFVGRRGAAGLQAVERTQLIVPDGRGLPLRLDPVADTRGARDEVEAVARALRLGRKGLQAQHPASVGKGLGRGAHLLRRRSAQRQLELPARFVKETAQGIAIDEAVGDRPSGRCPLVEQRAGALVGHQDGPVGAQDQQRHGRGLEDKGGVDGRRCHGVGVVGGNPPATAGFKYGASDSLPNRAIRDGMPMRRRMRRWT